jgi:hypothetical protein
MRPLEAVYLIVGVGIIVRGTIDHGLTPTELGAALFFIGLVPVGRRDRASREGRASGLSDRVASTLRRWSREGQDP